MGASGPDGTIRSVGVVGVGAMGAPIARRLAACGMSTTVCDRDERLLETFAAQGFPIARRVADCGEVDMVIVLVATMAQVTDVVSGQDGLMSRLSAERPSTLVVMSTVPAEALRQLRQQLIRTNIRLLDAPISGGVRRAEAGELTIMIGGDPDDVEAVRPVLSRLASHVFHCGGVGSAQTVKILNNAVCLANTLVTAEVYRLAADLGIDHAQLSRVLDVSTGRNFLTGDPDGVPSAYSTIAPNAGAFDSILTIMRKDIALLSDLAGASKAPRPALDGLQAIFAKIGQDTFDTWRSLAPASR